MLYEPATKEVNLVSRGAAASPDLKRNYVFPAKGRASSMPPTLGTILEAATRHREFGGICSETASAGQPGEGTDTSSTVPLCSPALPTYRAAVEGGSDVGVVVVGHLLVVGAQEADGLVVAVGGGVMPGDGLVAVVRDVLVG